jgi:hypothetical protein
MNDVSLEKFLSRPVEIQSFDWATGAPNIYERFNPWNDFFTEPRIANRIAHYAFMRCKLKIRVLINGNAFHFGRAILSYIPLPNLDNLTTDRVFVQQDLIQASQRPHIYLDPTYSQGGELGLPFFYPKNMLSIVDSEYGEMGELSLHTINVLKHANGATDNVTINVFAWAEDVVLSGPTAGTDPALEPQAGSDEYGVGIVSKPASIVARIAGKLSGIPVIAPYARATEIGAGALAALAGAFGYCRPNVLTPTQPFKPNFAGNMANTNMEDSCNKLSLDAKQELTIDPRTVGLSGVDEMGVKNVASRESYLTTFNWATTGAPKGSYLWGSAVTPILWDTNGVNPNQELHLPACCFATLPFQWWRGTMKFRFQIVASNFHRGRLRVVYEPWASAPTLDYTTNYNRIIDIAEEKDFTLEIGWNQNQPYMQCHNPGYQAAPFGSSWTATPGDARTNGSIFLYVVNDLTVPNSIVDNDIQVNVFVSCGDEFEVAGPTSFALKSYTAYSAPVAPLFLREEDSKPLKRKKEKKARTKTTVEILNIQSGVDDIESTTQPSAPMQDATQQIGSMSISDNDMTNHVFFGEEIKSFRTLLRRYALHNYNSNNDAAGTDNHYWWELRSPAFPYPRGFSEDPAMFSVCNICEMTPLNWVSLGYTGWRGGIRRKLFLGYNENPAAGGLNNTNSQFNIAGVIRTQNYSANGSAADPYFSSIRVIDSSSYQADLMSAQGIFSKFSDGGTANPLSLNPVQEVEIPFYNTWRFLPTKRDSNNLTNMANVQPPAYESTMRVDGNNVTPSIHDFVATAEDFNLFFFTGCPVIYRNDIIDPTPPV